MDNILQIHNLTISYESADGTVHAVNDLSLDVVRGKTLGLVGETGAGKTTTAKSIMGLLPPQNSKIETGQVLLDGENLFKLSKKEMRKIRGATISMIYQDPMTSLNPVMRVGEQLNEVILLHQTKNRQEATKKMHQVLEQVGIKADRASEYPHQFSGGMKQRVGIAMALACSPKLLIADEPTTALDVTIQAQVLELMKKLKTEYDMAMLMITHDLGIVAEICDYVAVMYAGRIVEHGSVEHIFNSPQHPYTVGLFNCIPKLTAEQDELMPIPGAIPDPSVIPKGCSFAPRCPHVMDACNTALPPNVETKPGHWVRCCQYSKEEGQNG